MLALAGGYQRTGYSVTLPPRLNDTGAQPDAARLGLLNVGYVAASFPIEVEGLTLEAQFGETYVYANEQVLPRSFVVTQEQAPASDRVALQHPLEVTPADVVVYTPNRIVVKADAAAPGLLVLSEIWYPGWQALVDGNPVPIQCVENALRGVPLDAGPHTIEFRYAPWTVRAGLVISGTTALALAGYAVTRLISARRHR